MAGNGAPNICYKPIQNHHIDLCDNHRPLGLYQIYSRSLRGLLIIVREGIPAVAGRCLVTLHVFSGSRVIFWILKVYLIHFFIIFLKKFHSVCVCVCSFSLSTIWVLGMEFWSLGFTVGPLFKILNS